MNYSPQHTPVNEQEGHIKAQVYRNHHNSWVVQLPRGIRTCVDTASMAIDLAHDAISNLSPIARAYLSGHSVTTRPTVNLASNNDTYMPTFDDSYDIRKTTWSVHGAFVKEVLHYKSDIFLKTNFLSLRHTVEDAQALGRALLTIVSPLISEKAVNKTTEKTTEYRINTQFFSRVVNYEGTILLVTNSCEIIELGVNEAHLTAHALLDAVALNEKMQWSRASA